MKHPHVVFPHFEIMQRHDPHQIVAHNSDGDITQLQELQKWEGKPVVHRSDIARIYWEEYEITSVNPDKRTFVTNGNIWFNVDYVDGFYRITPQIEDHDKAYLIDLVDADDVKAVLNELDLRIQAVKQFPIMHKVSWYQWGY